MRGDRDHRRVLSEINVTPLVDVMLVLLVIFMITAPMMQYGTDVNLPQSKGRELPTEERISITVKKGGKILMNKTEVSVEIMREKLNALSERGPNIYLFADKDVPYGLVAEVMGEIKEAGIEKLGMVTTPKSD